MGPPTSPVVAAAALGFKDFTTHEQVKKLLKVLDESAVPSTLAEDLFACVRLALPKLTDEAIWEILAGRVSAPIGLDPEDVPEEVWQEMKGENDAQAFDASSSVFSPGGGCADSRYASRNGGGCVGYVFKLSSNHSFHDW